MKRYALVIAGCVFFGASSVMANAIRLDNQTDADIVVSCDNYAYQASLPVNSQLDIESSVLLLEKSSSSIHRCMAVASSSAEGYSDSPGFLFDIVTNANSIDRLIFKKDSYRDFDIRYSQDRRAHMGSSIEIEDGGNSELFINSAGE